MTVTEGKQIPSDLPVVPVGVKLSVIGRMREQAHLPPYADSCAFPGPCLLYIGLITDAAQYQVIAHDRK